MSTENISENHNSKALSQIAVSNSFICDSCEIEKNNNQSVMITDEWVICKSCFEKDKVKTCNYSSYCSLTGECDESC